MKKTHFIAVLLFSISTSIFSQEVKNDDILTYSCDEKIDLNDEDGIVVLTGNVNLKTSIFEFVDADKITIHQKTNEIIVNGAYRVYVHGGSIEQSPDLKKKHLRYKLGEKVAYIE